MKYEIELNHKDYLLLLDTLTEVWRLGDFLNCFKPAGE